MAERKQWICATLDTPGGERADGAATVALPMGVAAKKKLWPKDTVLKVRFLGGKPALHDRVLDVARTWLVPRVRLKMERVTIGEAAQLRIAFDAGSGSWSYVGTDNLGIHPAAATMNLGWATLDTPDDDFSSVVVHEFGHALGLLHEHNHPKARIGWNRPAVIADLSGDPNFWDLKTIEDNVFAKFAAGQVVTTPFDQASVMIYTVPSNWTVDGRSFMPSPRLSDGDRATVQRLYA